MYKPYSLQSTKSSVGLLKKEKFARFDQFLHMTIAVDFSYFGSVVR